MILTVTRIARFLFVLALGACPAIAQEELEVWVPSDGFREGDFLNATVNNYVNFRWEVRGLAVYSSAAAVEPQTGSDGSDNRVCVWRGSPKNREFVNPIVQSCDEAETDPRDCVTGLSLDGVRPVSYWLYAFHSGDDCAFGGAFVLDIDALNADPSTLLPETKDEETQTSDETTTEGAQNVGTNSANGVGSERSSNNPGNSEGNKGMLAAGVVLIILAALVSALAFVYTRRKLREAKVLETQSGASNNSRSVVLTSPGSAGVAHAPPMSPPVVFMGRTHADQESDSDPFQSDDPFMSNQFSSIEYRPGESGRTTGRY